MANPDQTARNGSGRYHRTPESIARDTEVARLYYEEHLTFQKIAERMGWKDKSSAMRAVNRVMQEAGEPAKELRDRRDREIQFLWDAAMEIYERTHITVSHGHVVEVDGVPLEDDGPRLQAIEQLRKLNVEWRRLHGTDAAVKVDATIHEVTQQDLELQEMVREAKARVAAEEQQIRNGGADA